MKEKNVDFVYSGYQSFLNSPQGFRGFLSALYLKILARIQSPLCSRIVDRIKFIKNYNVNLQTVMIKTSCIKNTLFDDRLNLMGDLDFFYKILWGERATVYYDSAVSALTRVHHTQLSRKSSQDWFQESKQVAESFHNMLSPSELKYFTYYFTNFYHTQVLFDQGQRLKANVLKMKYLSSGIRYWPHFIKSVLFRSF